MSEIAKIRREQQVSAELQQNSFQPVVDLTYTDVLSWVNWAGVYQAFLQSSSIF